ncbi:MAG: hypothetical protein ACRC2Y_04375 [Aeromonas veronii]
MSKFTVAEVKGRINAKFKNSPLSVNAAYYQNECHIRVRAETVQAYFDQGLITEKQLVSLNKWIADLKAKYL